MTTMLKPAIAGGAIAPVMERVMDSFSGLTAGSAFETETINAAEAARFLHIHTDTLYDRARSGEVPGCKIGRSWVFMKSLLVEYVRCRSKDGKAPLTGTCASLSLA